MLLVEKTSAMFDYSSVEVAHGIGGSHSSPACTQ